MKYTIQSRTNEYITIYIDMIEYCNDITLKREQRSSFICKTNKPTLYLGGKVLITKNHFNYFHVSKSQFKETGVDFNLWQSLFKKVCENLNNNK